jgi:hypothetical protein
MKEIWSSKMNLEQIAKLEVNKRFNWRRKSDLRVKFAKIV